MSQCRYCGADFEPKRSDHIFCNLTCNDKYHSERCSYFKNRHKLTPEAEITFWKKQLRLLRDWDIIYVPHIDFTGQSHRNPQNKTGIIYPYDSSKTDYRPKDYIAHEMVHMAFSTARDDRELEEIFVQDICRIIQWRERTNSPQEG